MLQRRNCGCLLLPLLMPAADEAVCCYPAAACLRLPTNAAVTTDAPHQMSLKQSLLPLTVQESRIDSTATCQNCWQSSRGKNIFYLLQADRGFATMYFLC
jgi:hypothetical protein